MADSLAGIRADHVARYRFAAGLMAPGQRAFDAGCGCGYGSAILADAGAHVVYGVDASAEAVTYARTHWGRGRNVVFNVTDLEKLMVAPDVVDLAVAFEVLEHLPVPGLALRALHRMAPRLVCSVPNETLYPFNGRNPFHVRHYTPTALVELLEAHGWRVASLWHQAGGHGAAAEVRSNPDGRFTIAVCDRVARL